jgi:hypothetical protein
MVSKSFAPKFKVSLVVFIGSFRIRTGKVSEESSLWSDVNCSARIGSVPSSAVGTEYQYRIQHHSRDQVKYR